MLIHLHPRPPLNSKIPSLPNLYCDIMAGELEDLRDDLEGIIEGAWGSEEAVGFAQDLEDAFSDDAVEGFEDCAESPGQSFQDCLEKVADEHGVGDALKSSWDTNAPVELLTALRSVQAKWSKQDKERVAKVARSANLSELNRLCAEGEYSDVQSKAGLDTAPSTFQECVQLVADAKSLRENLKSLWGTAS